MKPYLRLILLCASCTVACGEDPASTSASTESNPSIVVDGVRFENIRWGRATPAYVTIYHKSGVATIPLEDLPMDLQKQFGYDPEKAAAFRATQSRQALSLEQEKQREVARKAVEGTAREVSGKVVQAIQDGALVQTAALGLVYVEGLMNVYDDQPWQGKAYPAGNYEYTTVQGAYKKVPAYSLRPTAHAVAEALKKQNRPPVERQDRLADALKDSTWTWTGGRRGDFVETITFDDTLSSVRNNTHGWTAVIESVGSSELTLGLSSAGGAVPPKNPAKAKLKFSGDFSTYTGNDFGGNSIFGKRSN